VSFVSYSFLNGEASYFAIEYRWYYYFPAS